MMSISKDRKDEENKQFQTASKVRLDQGLVELTERGLLRRRRLGRSRAMHSVALHLLLFDLAKIVVGCDG